MSFVNSYSHHFVSYRHDMSEQARQYAKGLMQADRGKKNMERMAEAVPDSDPRNPRQFLAHSKWSAFHHHMALVMMTTLFMLSERIRNADAIPLLSCADIERLPARFLPRRDVAREEVLRQMEKRHRRRRAAIGIPFASKRKKYEPRSDLLRLRCQVILDTIFGYNKFDFMNRLTAILSCLNLAHRKSMQL